MSMTSGISRRLRFWLAEWQNQRQIARLARQAAAAAQPGDGRPVVFFNASTRLSYLSLNAAFSSLTAWGLRLAGVPVVHFVCRSGLSRCVLGTNPDNHKAAPPCEKCIAQSKRLYAGAQTHEFTYRDNPRLIAALAGLNIEELSNFVYKGAVYGVIATTSLRWILRRYHLPDDEPTRYLLKQFILSAYHVEQEFEAFLDQTNPRAVVVFNGMMYPEAMVRRAARRRGLPVITHEVSFQPFSAFFTPGEATAYPIDIPDDFELNPNQEARLDEYLGKRFQGQFTMAGIQFWPEMRDLDEDLQAKIAKFKQVVPVFTNVIFDTSQPHANTVFEHMFAWLDMIHQIIQAHPETLFVIRSHPDELRPGTRKQARESVSGWVQQHGVDKLPNVVFIDSQDYVSSYALIQRAKFVLVYNSSIGLEAVLMGVPVLCGGKARFTQYPIVFFRNSPEGYRQQAKEFLAAEQIEIPAEFMRNARRFLYYQLYRTPLSFADYLEAQPLKGYVRFKPFPLEQLSLENSPTLRTIYNGIMQGETFLTPDDLAE